jgi:hypothetical protein
VRVGWWFSLSVGFSLVSDSGAWPLEGLSAGGDELRAQRASERARGGERPPAQARPSILQVSSVCSSVRSVCWLGLAGARLPACPARALPVGRERS